ncbi:substrate-binding domain-containing protein [Mastigocladopsis repens]|uniref:substrate-binding domain-containing protein n=1 Tax=Mastigocladopsis repens TaxID=221287 RepID=UPI00037E53AA|nr:substrate-binding domain-containing protein [Mastigocladopsis repens]
MESGYNNVKKCRNCGTLNLLTANKCGYCGQKLRRNSIRFIVWVWFPLVALAGSYFLLKPTLSAISSDTLQNTSSSTPYYSPETSSSIHPPVSGVALTTYRTIADVPNVPQGTFNYGGSTTFAPLRSTTLLVAINLAYPGFQLRYTEPLTGEPGSGNGMSMLLEGQLSFSQSSRSVKDEEFEKAQKRNFKLEQVPVAIDGIAFYVHPQVIAQGLKGITLTQARDIFTGKITNWKEVGGSDVPIAPFSRNLKYGGTVDFLYEKVLEEKPFGASVQQVRDTTDSLKKVATTPGGIGYATASQLVNQKTIRVLPLAKEANSVFVSPCADHACTAINETAFADDSYPITRRLFVIIKRDGKLDEQAGVAYANMLLSNEGQKLVDLAGFVPIR